MTGYEAFCLFSSLKLHFTQESYDYFKYAGKSRASVASFNKRKDRYFFERCSRKMADQEIVEYFLSNFVVCDDPQKVWIGEMIQTGEVVYTDWKKKSQSLTYLFCTEVENVFSDKSFDSMFECKKGQHPQILKEHLRKNLSIETLIILDKVLNYSEKFDRILDDLVWKTVSHKIKKYSPFMLNIDISKFKNLLKERIKK